MLGISWYEYLVIAVVALIVIGPKELPAVLRTIGQWTAKVQRMAAEFRGQFQEAMREAEMADLKRDVDKIREQAHSFSAQLNDQMNLEDATKWESAEVNKTSEVNDAAATGKPDEAAMRPEESPATPEPAAAHGGEAHGGEAEPAPAAEQPASVQTAVAPESAPPASPGTAPKEEEGVHS